MISFLLVLAGCLSSSPEENQTSQNISLVLFLKEMGARNIPVYCNLTTMDVVITPNYSVFYIGNQTYITLNNTTYYLDCTYAPIQLYANYTYLPELPKQCGVLASHDFPCQMEQNQTNRTQ